MRQSKRALLVIQCRVSHVSKVTLYLAKTKYFGALIKAPRQSAWNGLRIAKHDFSNSSIPNYRKIIILGLSSNSVRDVFVGELI
ncbi:MAG: hypothetical protein ACI92E_002950 [Oceanicoccus sp.]|jgi:hypothetical protein